MNYLNCLKNIAYKQKNLLIVLGSVTFGVLIAVVFMPKPEPIVVRTSTGINKAQDKLLTSQLSDIQIQLSMLRQEVKKPKKQVDLSSVNHDLKGLEKLFKNIKVSSDGSIKETIYGNKLLAKKLDSITGAVDAISLAQNKVKYIDAKALPFKVLAIDNIQEQSVVAIEYNFSPTVLESGDSLAGWKVVSLDYGHQLAEFENKEHEHVQLSIKSIG